MEPIHPSQKTSSEDLWVFLVIAGPIFAVTLFIVALVVVIGTR
jgi:hypothetical protein